MATPQQIKDAYEQGIKAGREGRALSACLSWTGKSANKDIKAAFMRGYLEGQKTR